MEYLSLFDAVGTSTTTFYGVTKRAFLRNDFSSIRLLFLADAVMDSIERDGTLDVSTLVGDAVNDWGDNYDDELDFIKDLYDPYTVTINGSKVLVVGRKVSVKAAPSKIKIK